jgi:hypothetical protein
VLDWRHDTSSQRTPHLPTEHATYLIDSLKHKGQIICLLAKVRCHSLETSLFIKQKTSQYNKTNNNSPSTKIKHLKMNRTIALITAVAIMPSAAAFAHPCAMTKIVHSEQTFPRFTSKMHMSDDDEGVSFMI